MTSDFGMAPLEFVRAPVAQFIFRTAALQVGSTSRIPSMVLNRTRKNTVTATRQILDSMPMPNAITNSGARAIFGMRRNHRELRGAVARANSDDFSAGGQHGRVRAQRLGNGGRTARHAA